MSDLDERLLKPGVALVKGRGRLRPGHQVRMSRIRRADDFAVRRAGLRDSRDIGLALLCSEPREFGNMLVPFARAQPSVVARHVQIRLDEHGGGRWRWPIRRNGNPNRTHRHQQNAAKPPGLPPMPERPGRTAIDEQAARKQCVDGEQHKRDAVDAGPWRQWIHQRVVHLRVAKLIPRHRRDARCRQVQRGPQHGSGRKSPAHILACLPHQRDAQAEEAAVKSQHRAIADQQQNGEKSTAYRRNWPWCRGPR